MTYERLWYALIYVDTRSRVSFSARYFFQRENFGLGSLCAELDTPWRT